MTYFGIEPTTPAVKISKNKPLLVGARSCLVETAFASNVGLSLNALFVSVMKHARGIFRWNAANYDLPVFNASTWFCLGSCSKLFFISAAICFFAMARTWNRVQSME